MFGGTKAVCEETLAEVRTLRRRVDELAGRGDGPPLKRSEFYNRVDAAADTSELCVTCVHVARVLSVAFRLLREMPERERAAMVRELIG